MLMRLKIFTTTSNCCNNCKTSLFTYEKYGNIWYILIVHLWKGFFHIKLHDYKQCKFIWSSLRDKHLVFLPDCTWKWTCMYINLLSHIKEKEREIGKNEKQINYAHRVRTKHGGFAVVNRFVFRLLSLFDIVFSRVDLSICRTLWNAYVQYYCNTMKNIWLNWKCVFSLSLSLSWSFNV